MFTKKQVPPENPQIKQYLNQVLGVTGATADQKSVNIFPFLTIPWINQNLMSNNRLLIVNWRK